MKKIYNMTEYDPTEPLPDNHSPVPFKRVNGFLGRPRGVAEPFPRHAKTHLAICPALAPGALACGVSLWLYINPMIVGDELAEWIVSILLLLAAAFRGVAPIALGPNPRPRARLWRPAGGARGMDSRQPVLRRRTFQSEMIVSSAGMVARCVLLRE